MSHLPQISDAVATSPLANGLKVVSVYLPHLHTATLVLCAKVGSRFESPSDNGLSHFVEHMLYRGCKRYPSSYELSVAFESLGGTLHAETGRDSSSYQLTVSPNLVETGLELLNDLFRAPIFSDVDLEREIILEELSEDFNEDGVEINGPDTARALVFGSHPLAQRIIGPRKNVKSFGRDDIQRHFETYYGASNLVLCVAGPIEHDKVHALASRKLGNLPTRKAATTLDFLPSQTSARYEHIDDRGSQTSVTLLWRAAGELAANFSPNLALLRALDDGMSTPLHYRLCDQQGLAYSVGASIEPFHDVSLVEIGGSTGNDKTPPPC